MKNEIFMCTRCNRSTSSNIRHRFSASSNYCGITMIWIDEESNTLPLFAMCDVAPESGHRIYIASLLTARFANGFVVEVFRATGVS